MPKRVSKIASSLKQLGDIQVTDWDFMELLNTEIKDLEISRSLKRLGSIQVMDWDFRTVIPAVKKVANQEVDVVDLFKRTAHYKVMDWDFRSALQAEPAPQQASSSAAGGLSPDEMQAVTTKLKNFLAICGRQSDRRAGPRADQGLAAGAARPALQAGAGEKGRGAC